MSSEKRSSKAAERPRPLTKEEIDRRIERVLADLSAAIDAAASGGEFTSDDPLRPRRVPRGALTSRMRRLVGDN